ncbi:MAG TPA: Hsp70 family protein [Thermoanaerobaculia bacterium]|nr:Hsp70 family protein [Thermoanaerobaculia bacterium]
MTGWALDLGTTNSGVALWDESLGRPRLVELPAVCRKPAAEDPLEAPRLVPSAIHFLEKPRALDRLGSWPPLARRFFIGRRALIGRQALERNDGASHPSFVPTFKPSLSVEALRPLARLGRESLTARDAAHAFLRELLREVKTATGHRVRDLVVTSPVSAFETYRAEVQQVLRRLGVSRVRFIDEPVAAALGYGISLSHERTVLVVDVGGGTMHVVLVRLSPQGAASGQATVLAKRGRPLGGNAVDGWVLQDLCSRMGHDLTGDDADEVDRLWRRLMLAEACRVKEAVFFEEEAAFLMSPGGPASRQAPRPGSGAVKLTRDRLREVLEENGFYRSLSASLDEVFEQSGVATSDVEDVLLVGGSTLLPGFFSWFEERFERRRVRAWQPFEAVAYGAACFAGDRMDTQDFIVHDYAFVTHDLKTGEPQHTVIVPRGTRFPTSPELWKRQLVPTCALGEPESVFKLLICEVGRADGGERRFVWDAAGDVHKVGGTAGDAQVVVPLNAASPTLGYLDPPHSPRDRHPRLEIAFGVSTERWLIATVRDLLTQRDLMREEPVVRLV